MAKMRVQSMLTLYTIVFVTGISLVCIVFYLGIRWGVQSKQITLANSEEVQVQHLIDRIQTENNFSPMWLPEGVGYLQLDAQGNTQATTLGQEEQMLARAALDGAVQAENPYFMYISYKGGYIVFSYYIGMRYQNTWANTHLPNPEILISLAFIGAIVLLTIAFASKVRRRLQRDMQPLFCALTAMSQGDLTVRLPELSLAEFVEQGKLIEHMQKDLKTSLEDLWQSKQEIQESTTQMLHDIRTPLTIAKAHTSFLEEDATHAEDSALKAKVLSHCQALAASFEQLEDKADTLQHRIKDHAQAPLDQTVSITAISRAVEVQANLLASSYHAHFEFVACESDRRLAAEKGAVLQALLYVISNAFEHGTKGQTVRLISALEKSSIRYTVINSGSRFSDRALHCALNKGFSEGKGLHANHQGLGLYYTHELVKKCKGKIELSNTEEGFASVVLEFPLSN